jgi:hypothetical protein
MNNNNESFIDDEDREIENIINKPVDLKFSEPSSLSLYTIPEGTILYHGSLTIKQFNTSRIMLNNSTSVAFFSPNRKISETYIDSCSKYPDETGFIHKFIVNKDIDSLYILAFNDENMDWNVDVIKEKFCDGTIHGNKLNGIGFFIPESNNNKQGSNFSSEFSLCNPSAFLTYIGTFTCSSTRKMTEEYNIDK